MRTIKYFVIFAMLSLFIVACAQSESPSNSAQNEATANESPAAANATPEIQDEVALGKKHYTEQCVKCHKENGTGGRVEIEGKTLKAEDLTSAKMAKEPDEEYIEYITEGIQDEGMPSFKKILTEDEIKHVVKYIRADLQK